MGNYGMCMTGSEFDGTQILNDTGTKYLRYRYRYFSRYQIFPKWWGHIINYGLLIVISFGSLLVFFVGDSITLASKSRGASSY